VAASNDDLGLVHKLMTQWCLDLLRGDLKELKLVKGPDGEVVEQEVTIRPSAAELSVIRAFLKDNDITGDSETNRELAELQNRLQQRVIPRPFNPEVDLGTH